MLIRFTLFTRNTGWSLGFVSQLSGFFACKPFWRLFLNPGKSTNKHRTHVLGTIFNFNMASKDRGRMCSDLSNSLRFVSCCRTRFVFARRGKAKPKDAMSGTNFIWCIVRKIVTKTPRNYQWPRHQNRPQRRVLPMRCRRARPRTSSALSWATLVARRA